MKSQFFRNFSIESFGQFEKSTYLCTRKREIASTWWM